ncbi:unnamed protein product [Caenorhabditis auriculariae]|uniref:Uncharacterized protein n=1 Tax=Caenorhabditis auriculariae TaxID=2777116 RepID=A0A8S1HX88_9PELO|nr:unnamed protein product [Caenorhabditis auriculariae]
MTLKNKCADWLPGPGNPSTATGHPSNSLRFPHSGALVRPLAFTATSPYFVGAACRCDYLVPRTELRPPLLALDPHTPRSNNSLCCQLSAAVLLSYSTTESHLSRPSCFLGSSLGSDHHVLDRGYSSAVFFISASVPNLGPLPQPRLPPLLSLLFKSGGSMKTTLKTLFVGFLLPLATLAIECYTGSQLQVNDCPSLSCIKQTLGLDTVRYCDGTGVSSICQTYRIFESCDTIPNLGFICCCTGNLCNTVGTPFSHISFISLFVLVTLALL